MKYKLIKMGDSMVVEIPKSFLEKCDLDEHVYIKISDKSIIINAEEDPRAGWAEAIDKAGPDNFENEEEWKWED